MKLYAAILLAVGFLFSSIVSAEFVFSAPPRERSGEGVMTYGPLVERLSEALGDKVVYQQPDGWPEYTDKLRHNEYDIIFDGPHFTAWRIKHIGYTAVARLPGYLAFNIVTKEGDKRFTDLGSLRTAAVCAFESPNLTSSLLLYQFRDEVVVPHVIAVNGDTGDIINALDAGKCDAAVVRDQFYDKMLSDEQRAGLKIVYTSRKFPNQGISVSNRLNPEQIKIIKAVLEQDDTSLEPVLNRFARKSRHFIPSRNSDFSGISALLEGVVWGW